MTTPDRPMRPAPSSSGLNWLLVIFVILVVGFVLRDRGRALLKPNAQEPPVVPRGDLAEDEKSTIALFKEASPSVVHITSIAVRRNPLNLDVLAIPQGTGSGFVWDKDG